MSCPISKKALPKLRKRWPHCKEIFLPDNAKRLEADGDITLSFDYRPMTRMRRLEGQGLMSVASSDSPA